MNENYIIVFDTETTGFSPTNNEIVQLSYILYDKSTNKIIHATENGEDIVNIKGKIPERTSKIHGIYKEDTKNKKPIEHHINEFIKYFNQATTYVGHNIKFDINMIIGQIRKFSIIIQYVNCCKNKLKYMESQMGP